MDKPILEYVLTELRDRKGYWPAIAARTKLQYSWLTKLAQGGIPEPGVNKIQKLADFFRAHSRELTDRRACKSRR